MDYYQKYQKYKKKYMNMITMDKNKFVPLLSLLRDHGTDGSFYNWKKQLGIKYDDAFCLKFKKGTKTLYYIAAMHTIDIDSLTYQYINYVITNFKPDIILIEGIPYEEGISPEITITGEGKYASDLAIKYNIPFSGIEGSEEKNLLLLAEKYNLDDIYGYMYLRMHKYYFNTMKLSEKEFENDFYKYGKKDLDRIFKKDLPWDSKKWFMDTFNKKFKYGKYLEYAAPYKNTKIITQKISFDYGKIRDMFNIENLYKFLNQYDTILYIMGQNHIYADLLVLINSFGGYEIVHMV